MSVSINLDICPPLEEEFGQSDVSAEHGPTTLEQTHRLGDSQTSLFRTSARALLAGDFTFLLFWQANLEVKF